MEKLWFNGMRLVKGKCDTRPTQRKHLVIGAIFKSDYSGKNFYWYPSYHDLECIIHFLAALHGEKEVTSRVLSSSSLIETYNKQIEKKLQTEEALDNEIPSC